jgi:hypothetical protein
MERNIYAIIQDWHELLKNGTITEDEFNSKKNELLNFEKLKNEGLEKEKEIDRIEYGKSKNFVCISFYIFAGVVCVGILFFNIYKRINKNEEQMESENYNTEYVKNNQVIGNYIIEADDANLVHFYDKPEISTVRKAYFSTKDTVYVSKIENDFGYVEFLNSNGKKSIGWLQLVKMNYCAECIN